MSPIPYEGRRRDYVKAVSAARTDALNGLRERYPKEWKALYEAAKFTRLRQAGLLKESDSADAEV